MTVRFWSVHGPQLVFAVLILATVVTCVLPEKSSFEPNDPCAPTARPDEGLRDYLARCFPDITVP